MVPCATKLKVVAQFSTQKFCKIDPMSGLLSVPMM